MPPEELPLPQFPGYEVEAVLGRGGMGVVFRARHLRLNRLVALKMALAGSYATPHERERFRREAEAVAALRHPNVVQVYDVGDADGRPYFTMELMEGGSLARKMAGAPQPPRQTAALLATLAEAMHAAHQAGIVHRDLKPANILFTPDGTPKVADFGLARRLEVGPGLTQSGVPLGTPSYMAPEQARGQSRAVGPAVDVYALGAILYECLTGRPPFRAAAALDTLLQVTTEEPAPPRQLNPQAPRDLETIALKCLQKQTHKRYASAAELADDLRRYLLGRVVAARPVGGLERAAKWVRRNPTVASLSALAALALVAVTVVSVLFGVEAGRKASELEVQTRAAQESAQRAEKSEKEVTRAMLAGLLIPIDNNPQWPFWVGDFLGPAEAEALRQLRGTSAPVRLQFLEIALDDPRTARKVGRRADWVAQAIVGCDRSVRADVQRLVVRRIQEPGAPQEVRLACARIGLAVNLGDRAWAERSADALLGALRDPLIEVYDYSPLAEALAAVSERLPLDQAADYAAQATDVLLTRLRDRSGQLLADDQLGQAIVAVSPRLDAGAATRAARGLAAHIRRPGIPASAWQSVSRALAAVCRQLPPSDSVSYLSETVDFIIAARGATMDELHRLFQAKALGALGGRLDSAGVTRVAEAIRGMLGDGEPLPPLFVAQALAEVAEHLDPEASRRTAEQLVLVLRYSKGDTTIPETLKSSLVSACRRLDTAGTARVSDAILAAVRNPQTSIQGHTLFADAFVVLCGQLDPDRVASLEDALVGALVADLADPKSVRVRRELGLALASVCGRPGTRSAARAAEALVAALRDPHTNLGFLKPLAEALAAVGGQLAPTEAALHAKRAVAVLGSLWVKKTGPGERAAVAGAMAAVWRLLGPDEAGAHARRTADELEIAFRDANVTMMEHSLLAQALAAVYRHLGPAERVRRTNAVADALIAALRRPAPDVGALGVLSEALTALCLNLDRPGAARMADALLTVFGEPHLRQQRFELSGETFKNLAVRMEESDLQRLLDHPLAGGRVRRVILDFLGEAKHRYFRNTWDYLDWKESHGNGTAVRSPGS
jgi:hypothetical protein